MISSQLCSSARAINQIVSSESAAAKLTIQLSSGALRFETTNQNVMNANHIESKFAAMGARLKVREIPSRWRQGDRSWISPRDFAVDIRRDGHGAVL